MKIYIGKLCKGLRRKFNIYKNACYKNQSNESNGGFWRWCSEFECKFSKVQEKNLKGEYRATRGGITVNSCRFNRQGEFQEDDDPRWCHCDIERNRNQDFAFENRAYSPNESSADTDRQFDKSTDYQPLLPFVVAARYAATSSQQLSSTRLEPTRGWLRCKQRDSFYSVDRSGYFVIFFRLILDRAKYRLFFFFLKILKYSNCTNFREWLWFIEGKLIDFSKENYLIFEKINRINFFFSLQMSITSRP